MTQRRILASPAKAGEADNGTRRHRGDLLGGPVVRRGFGAGVD